MNIAGQTSEINLGTILHDAVASSGPDSKIRRNQSSADALCPAASPTPVHRSSHAAITDFGDASRSTLPENRGMTAFSRSAGAAFFLGVLSCSALASPQSVAERFEQASDAYDRCHWQSAFRQFSELADGGSPEAARIAFDMARFAEVLFGTSLPASAEQRARWRRVAATGKHDE